MAILLTGLNYKTAPVEVREKVSLSRPQIEKISERVRGIEAFSGCTILSTCNRTEFYINADSPFVAQEKLIALISDYSHIPERELAPYLYIKFNKNAVRHLFTVVAGMDSMILGESQIQGQVQDAYEYALNYNISDNILNTLFMSALTVGKRVRTETQIDRHTLSVSVAAVEMAKAFYGSLEDRKVLVLGAGETSELTSRYLISNGISSIMVANRTFERAEWLANEIGGQAVNFKTLGEHLPDTDLIITSTASPVPIIDKATLIEAQPDRERPLLMIDIAVPRDINPDVNALDYVTLYDIDDLARKTDENLAARQREVVKAKKIVDDEIEDFYFWMDSLWVVPTIVKMRDQIAKIKESEIERALNRIDNPSEREKRIIEQLANSIVNRWLHRPIINMKALAGKRADKIDCYVNAINDLWGLDKNDQKDN
ncbi:MAG: glutamyl-tRNA reductase [Peptococcaceae bacterium]|nr:glutamyl-tRNA reductase [Peptococcaceae bacterium]